MNSKTKCLDKSLKIVFAVLLCVYAVALFYLFYNQTGFFDTGLFESDLPFHLKFAVEDRFFYSFTTFIYLFFSKFSCFKILVALSLTAATVGSVMLTKALLDKAFKAYEIGISGGLSLMVSMALNFVLAFYIPWAGKSHYVAYQSGNLWHNSTYIFMRVFAELTLLMWMDFYDSYKDGIKASKWVLLSALLMVTTGIKASFFTVFGPVMALFLLYDLCRKVKFSKVFVAALTVVPSMAVMLIQSVVLFGDETGNGYIIKPFYTLSLRGEHPKAALVLSVLFPLCVGLMHVKDVLRDKLYIGSLLIWFFGFIEVFLFAETGNRSKDGNFLWGYSISLFILFIISAVKFIKDLMLTFGQKKTVDITSKFGWIKKIYLLGCAGIFMWHVISGVWYFVLLLTGVTYFV